ncbi:hypothetical protein L2E82_35723 [Cichorium intybus]|uniref:Uncharacterized protein n=1 Tax=Cichorium intybus TaxID=13427 RepID=A0ACB9BPP6_CICIN|nr:hypothetical protein L2E82_35723 [Cichorium intybus]
MDHCRDVVVASAIFGAYDLIEQPKNVLLGALAGFPPSSPWYTDSGFTVNGVHYEGSLLCLGNLMLSCSPRKMSDITTDMYMCLDPYQDCPQVHGNAAESLCAICRYAPPGLAARISSPSFIARLFHHELGELRPRAVLVNALSVCVCLLDPNRQPSGTPYIYNRQMTHGSTVATNPEIVEAMLESLGIFVLNLAYNSLGIHEGADAIVAVGGDGTLHEILESDSPDEQNSCPQQEQCVEENGELFSDYD